MNNKCISQLPLFMFPLLAMENHLANKTKSCLEGKTQDFKI